MSSSSGFLVVSILLAFEALQESWDVMFNPLNTIAYFHLLGIVGLVECQDVGVGFDFMFVTPCFPWTANISSFIVNASSLFLITPLEVLSFSHGQKPALTRKIFIFNILSACL